MSAFSLKIYIALLLGMILNSGFTQETESPKTLRKFAKTAEANKDYYTAIYYYKAYLDKKPEDLKAKFALAENYRFTRDYTNAEKNYKQLVDQEFDKEKLLDFHYANMLKANGKCDAAVPIYSEFTKSYRGEKDDRRYIKLAKKAIKGCQTLQNKESDRRITISQLNQSINGAHMEASPIFLTENQILFNSLKLEGENKFNADEDSLPARKFYKAGLNQNRVWDFVGEWEQSPKLKGFQIANGEFNLERDRFYFSACKENSTGKIDCDLYVLDLTIPNQEPMLLPSEVNSKYSETQVAVGKDYKDREVIYFVSDRKEGKGGLDIWYTTYSAKRKQYKAARNCGSKVNSVGDEMTPFVSPRNRKLFFSSNGHPGFGELDVFETVGERSKWAEPINLGSAVNTSVDELYYIESKKGGSGFFASNRKGEIAASNSSCCDDLYYFIDTESIIRQTDVAIVDKNNKVIKDAKVSVYQLDEKTGEKYLVQSNKTNEDGNIQFSLDPNLEYLVEVKKQGYYLSSDKISTKDYRTKSKYNLELNLEEISNQAIVIDNIYYLFDKSNLTEDAKITIDTTILPIMINNPDIVVEIGSHTDGRGTEGYNKKLSQDRAESVVKYLRQKGIAKDRMTAKGYGKSSPIAPNKNEDGSDNPEGRAKNRRTEFKVIGRIEVFEEDWD